MRDLLRHRDFRLLLTGQTGSMFGDWLLILVLGMWAKELTGSNAVAGSVLFAVAIPSLLAPLGGWLADRVRRRPLMISVDLLTGAAVSLLLLVRDRSDLWLIYVVAACYGASQVVFSAAMSGLVQQLVPADLLGPANGALTTVRQSLRLVGPLLGAGLYAWHGGGVVAVIDALTFVGSAASLALLRHREAAPQPHALTFAREVTAGAVHLRRSALLRRMTVASIITMLTFGFAESVFFAVIDGLGKPVTFLSVLSTFQGVGAIASGVAVTGVIRRIGEVRIFVAALAGCAVACALCALQQLPVVLGAVVVIGAALPALIVSTMTALQHRTPNALMGRVSAAFDLATGLPYTVSIGVGALLVSVLDYRIILLGMAGGLALAAGYAALRLPSADDATVAEATPSRDHEDCHGVETAESFMLTVPGGREATS
jgi:MFS family permease